MVNIFELWINDMLAFFHRVGVGGPLWQFTPSKKNWSEDNRKICITIDFDPPEKILEESQHVTYVVAIAT